MYIILFIIPFFADILRLTYEFNLYRFLQFLRVITGLTFTSCGFRGELFHWQPYTFLMIDHLQKPKIKSSALDKWIGSSSNLFTSYLSLLNLNVNIDSKPNR